MKEVFSVAIIGCGNRGAETYGRLMMKSDRFQIVALCDFDGERLSTYGRDFSVPASGRFSDEEKFFEKRRADICVIATMDKDHVRQCIRALELGYDILLEKPITSNREECEKLLLAQKKYGGKVLVCHVLRYAPAFIKTAELLKEGAIGRLISIQALEQVAYWHYAHSYVRGNWRRSEDTAPMILAKCCHDLDLLQYYAGSRCVSVSSVGDLNYFKAENAPKGAAGRCLDCTYVDTCPYSAKRIYLDTWQEKGKPDYVWPHIQITSTYPLTEEVLTKALREGDYGRCVFACDNDVVDCQITQMAFENGVTASLTMMPFTAGIGRRMTFFGTEGEIELNEDDGFIKVKPFGGAERKIDIREIVEGGGHGGGDMGLMNTLYEILVGKQEEHTSLEASIESHLMGICAEKSRLAGGKSIYVHSK